jgi:hypothetical protein
MEILIYLQIFEVETKMGEDYSEKGEDSNYLPAPNAAREEMDTILTGGRGIYTGSSCDRGSFLIFGAPGEVQSQRALLKMNIRDGKVPKSDLTKFDQKVEWMMESLP